MRTRKPVFPEDPDSPWFYTKHHSSSYSLYAIDDVYTVSWGKFKTITALRAYALDHKDNPFDYPF